VVVDAVAIEPVYAQFSRLWMPGSDIGPYSSEQSTSRIAECNAQQPIRGQEEKALFAGARVGDDLGMLDHLKKPKSLRSWPNVKA